MPTALVRQLLAVRVPRPSRPCILWENSRRIARITEPRQYVCKCVLSERWKSFSSRRSPACSRPELRRREAGRGVPGGERPVRNIRELDSAGCLGEPAANWRSPDRKRKPVTRRGRVRKRWRGTPGGWRRNGPKAKHMTQRDLSSTRQGSAGVRGAIVAMKPALVHFVRGDRSSERLQEEGCRMTGRSEEKPTTVPSAQPSAQQVGAAHPLWRCAKPCAWTARMLTTLIRGAEGGKAAPRDGISTAGATLSSSSRGCSVW